MKVLIVSDTHLTNNAQDEYRWEILEQAPKLAKEHGCEQIYHLGDITDKKDNHSSLLVNRVTELFTFFARHYPVKILFGNHDYQIESRQFFTFLDQIDNIQCFKEPTKIDNTYWLPHTRDPIEKWGDLNFDKVNLVFMHQSVIGSKMSNMCELNYALDLNWLVDKISKNVKIYSGDIHVPQDIRQLTYIGTPYPIAYGDEYNGRMIVLDLNTKKYQPILINHPRRLSLKAYGQDAAKDLIKENCKSNDSIKMVVTLDKKDLLDWQEIKAEIIYLAEKKKVNIASLQVQMNEEDQKQNKKQNEPKESLNLLDYIDQYCSDNELSDQLRKIGVAFFEESKR